MWRGLLVDEWPASLLWDGRVLKVVRTTVAFVKNYGYICDSKPIVDIYYHTINTVQYLFRYVYSIIIMFLVCPLAAHAYSFIDDNEELLRSLDSMVNDNSRFMRAKEMRIDVIKDRMARSDSDTERYGELKKLYYEYYTFDSDSAIHYAREALDLSQRMGMPHARAEWGTRMAYVYAACGLFPEALNVVSGIDGASLPEGLRADYYDTMSYLYSHYSLYLSDDRAMADEYAAKSNLYKDSLGMVIGEQSPQWLAHVVSKMGVDTPLDMLRQLEARVNSSHIDSRRDAMDAYQVAKTHEMQARPSEYIKYMIYSSMADVRSVNRDIASLQELAAFLYNHGDITRAYAYINYCLDQAHFYHNRIRMVSISAFQDEVRGAYLQQLREKDRMVRTSLIVVSVLAVVLLGLIAFMVRQYRVLRRNREQLAILNGELNERVEQLHAAHRDLSEAHDEQTRLNENLNAANAKLQESNAVKEEYIGYAFNLSTDYINDLDDLRKKLLRKVKTRQFGELADMLESESLVQGEMQRFYKSFDETFIRIFPNFLDEYNADQEPDDRIELKDGELLNTRLRIWALHRLGITESARIAKMLRCSIQTVYNNRPKRKRG